MQANPAFKDVSRETWDDLRAYEDLLTKWTKRINLVASSQLDELWERHILDSLQIAPLISKDASLITDIGSGGGLPGLVLAIHAKYYAPHRRINLVESDQRKAAFLRTVIRELKLNASIHAVRIEEVFLDPAEIVTARALAPLTDLLAHSEPLLKAGGTAIFPKGRTASEELETARETWQFTCHAVQSLTQPDARILVIKDIIRGNLRS
ncbi:16S rRNA (guanine(527)-N(7))-methyltransferase RsmG [Salipiger sp. IMCC34102]|uniref:16S rRNA (guanine(527)-N(7))-methyltransferase RsmG n=1 Tax=Salipiger sp. IMCC34102 TaxID=2510647 RepID=UPI00101B6DC5|nr:16S rRNA (guanine(527)-N(7))-methyltransferase RsmG [Salipiger sp. IMCC34102]RYH04213.1 16S rRNA (guanine(527)-N(7))-methyltransferase RsmG [Salipiger sp. IMCC34102]